MKNISINIAAIAVLLCLSFCVRAQNYTIVERDTTLTLSFDDDVEVVYAHLHLHYISDTPVYKITISDTLTDTSVISLLDPLSYDDLQAKINEATSDKFSKKTSVTTTSLNDIYNWLYNLVNFDDPSPMSGTLILNKTVILIRNKEDENRFNDPNNSIYDNYNIRAQIIASANNRLSSLNANLKIAKKNLSRILVGNIDTVNKHLTASKINIKDSLNAIKTTQKLIDVAASKIINSGALARKSDPVIITEFFSALRINSLDSIFSLFKADSANICAKYLDIVDAAYQLNKFRNDQSDTSICVINKITMQFERGFLETIRVDVQRENVSTYFENNYAIGFSSFYNFRELPTIRLFPVRSINKYPYILTSDVIANYNNVLDNYTRDYSPADTTIKDVSPNVHAIKLKKESLVNLFDSKIFTDIKGTGADAPNGLVQLEVSRRFNLNTIRYSLFSINSNYGLLNSFNLWGAINKIENKDKYLVLNNNNTVVNNTIVSPSYATNLDFRKYETSSFGMDFNLLLIDAPNLKFTTYIDAGARYGYVPLKSVNRTIDTATQTVRPVTSGDTVEVPQQASTITIFPRMRVEFLCEKRLRFQFAYQYNYTWLLSNNQAKQIVSYAKSDLNSLPIEAQARSSHMLELLLQIQTSANPNNVIFLRARVFMQVGDVNTSFSQFQIGYNYNLVFKK